MDYNGRIKLLCKDKLKFSYRESNLSKYIIFWAKLKLQKKNKDLIAAQMKQYLLMRSKAQNNSLPNAGCIFKNPAGAMTSGMLIDLCSLKGKIKGKAVISKIHANFILNLGNAKSSDVLFLMDLMRRKVKARFGVNLIQEIKLWR